MEMRIGERRIVATIEEREEARATYEQARKEGKKTALLDQKRPNLFATEVANINPGEKVSVRLEYLEEVAYADGSFGLTFPLTFTPRYTPASAPDPSAGGRIRRPAPVGSTPDSPPDASLPDSSTGEPLLRDASRDAPSPGGCMVPERSPLAPREII